MQHIFTLTQPYIELSKLLKFFDLVNNGGHAKDVILDGLVYVNWNQEYRIRNKLKVGDIVWYDGHEITIL
jgi:ribosome-associated protein